MREKRKIFRKDRYNIINQKVYRLENSFSNNIKFTKVDVPFFL